MEQAVGATGGSADVAMAVEHDEGVVVLEGKPAGPGRRPRHRNVERLVHHGLSMLCEPMMISLTASPRMSVSTFD